MSLILSWLGFGLRKPQELARPYDLPSPPDTPDSVSVIDKDEVIEAEKMVLLNATSSAIAQQIIATHAGLLTLPDLKPSKTVNDLLGALVPLCCELHDQRVVSQV